MGITKIPSSGWNTKPEPLKKKDVIEEIKIKKEALNFLAGAINL